MIVQGSPEWFAMRCGKVTASRVADVLAKTKTGWGAGRANYAAELIAERLTQTTAASFTNAAMQWGTDMEPVARHAYAMRRGMAVSEIGFVDHPEVSMSGASPDGLVDSDGLVEIKCPNTATHLDTLLSENVPSKYITQMQWQMACTGRDWCDFASFDPRLPEPLQLFVVRHQRDDKEIASYELALSLFLSELERDVAEMRQRMELAVA